MAPRPARVYDYLAGGNHNAPPDIELAEELARIYPGVRRLVRSNRTYLGAKVLMAYSQLEINQWLDLGSGFPGPGSVRDQAQQADPQARVACVDLEPMVARYGIRLAADGHKGFSVATADIRDPQAVLAHPEVTGVLDLAEPVAVVLGLVLQTMTPDEARDVVAGYASRIAAGSAVVVTVPVNGDPDLFSRLSEAWQAPLVNYTAAEAGSLFDGLEVLPPGVGPALWAGSGRLAGDPPFKLYVAGGVGVKKRLRAVRRGCHCLCPQVHPEVPGICKPQSAETVRTVKTQVIGEAEFAMCQPCADARDAAKGGGHDPVLVLPVVRRWRS